MIRFFDIVFSFLAIIILSPLIMLIAIWIPLESDGGALFRQWRIGKNGKPFRIWKFRTMHTKADVIRAITIGTNDNRITRAGLLLRKYKLDELPQLYNVLTGSMSLVGPRPELQQFVNGYTEHQLEILSIRPGITDLASLIFSDENHLLSTVHNPELFYEKKVIPLKLRLNRIYVFNHSAGVYCCFIYWSILHLLHIPCTRLQQLENNCKEWMRTATEPIVSSSGTMVNLPVI
jgi:lipopolysaccharide/colanic/teichoic acid biosynthesis glycosyltransferase